MKLIYLANSRIPTEKAHGIQIFAMCKALSQVGVSVELLAPRRLSHLKKTDPFDYYDTPRIFKVTKLPCLDPIRFFKSRGFWIQTMTFLLSAKVFLAFKEFDILYTREQIAGLFFKNFVLEIHSLPEKITSFHKKIWGKSRKLVVISNALKRELIKYGVSENKILVAPDGVDIERFTPTSSPPYQGGEREGVKLRTELGLPLDKKLILYTGHLYDWKGAGTLLKAASFMSLRGSRLERSQEARDDDTVFIFIGGTEHDIKLFGAQAKGLDNVLILGHKPHSEIPKYLAAADVLVLPNSGKEEISRSYTSPLKMFEYMAAGKSIVASDLPSIREVLNTQNAILVEPDNPEVLAQGIKRVLGDKDLANRISHQAQLDVQKYSWGNRAKTILKFL